MKNFLPGLLATAALGLGLASCQSATTENNEAGSADLASTLLTPGHWNAQLTAQGQQIPFRFEVKTEAAKPVVYLVNEGLNGEERLRCDEISSAGDSVTIKLHVFDAALVVRKHSGDSIYQGPSAALQGAWVKYDAKTPYRVPFQALKARSDLFIGESKDRTDFPLLHTAQTFKAEFTDDEGQTYPAVGIFRKDPVSDKAYGTFLTTTGDYRFLSGNLVKNSDGSNHLMLSTFDGNHGYLFDGTLDGSRPDKIVKGDFYSGKSGHETWTAVLDPKAKLPDADTLTYLKKGESRLSFKFPSIFEGGVVEPTAPKYKGKVVVIQLLGSWCPNCMDETAFLAPWYEKNKARGVEIIGLGYERSPDYKKASERLRKLRERYNIGYELAVAGVSNKDSVAKSLPQLAKFLAFPTTFFLYKKGAVRSIHTGFAGPGTGKYYEEEMAGFNRTVDKLLKE